MPDIKNAAAAAPVKKVPFAVSEAYKFGFNTCKARQ